MNDEPTIAQCDVCFLVDGDQRQKVCYYCGRCDAWICENCQPNFMRRGHAMVKRRVLRFLGIAAALLVGLAIFPPASHAQTFELLCPTSQYNISPVSPVLNLSNGKYRQWLCADASGNITIQSTGSVGINIQTCAVASDVVVSGTPIVNFCTFNIPSTQNPKIWIITCDILWLISSATGNIGINVSLPQLPSSTTHFGAMACNQSSCLNNPVVAISTSGVTANVTFTAGTTPSNGTIRLTGTYPSPMTGGNFIVSASGSVGALSGLIQSGTSCLAIPPIVGGD